MMDIGNYQWNGTHLFSISLTRSCHSLAALMFIEDGGLLDDSTQLRPLGSTQRDSYQPIYFATYTIM
jgi:hypothetical protein